MIENRTLFTADNLPILRGMDSESVDLIYLDPPFNSNRHYSAPIGSNAAGASFKDAWTFEDTDEAWWSDLAKDYEALYKVIDAAGEAGGPGDKAYLIYMAIRLLEMHRILKPTGSIYLHCDPTMAHSLKLTMDAIFRKRNFRNEIVWCYRGAGYPKRDFGRRHDLIYRYSETDVYVFNLDAVREEYAESTKKRFKHYIGNKRNARDFGEQSLNPIGKHPDDWWQIQPIAPSAKERVGYPTQKPRALLERIIKASSNPGDLVLDPFCGCATTCIAAEMLQRQWIGIDISPRAVELVKLRAENEIGGLFSVLHRTDIPMRDAPPRSRDIKEILFGKQRGVCTGCKISFPYSNLEIDHIVPRSKGGADTDDNVQLLCGHCNRVKGVGTMEELRVKLRP